MDDLTGVHFQIDNPFTRFDLANLKEIVKGAEASGQRMAEERAFMSGYMTLARQIAAGTIRVESTSDGKVLVVPCKPSEEQEAPND